MSESKDKRPRKVDESWGAGLPSLGRKEQSKPSGIEFFQGSGGQAMPGADSREVFVGFACEQVMRDFDVGAVDLRRGIIPDSRKKAFAAAYLLAGGKMVRSEQEAERLEDAGEGAKLDLVLLQASRETEFGLDRLWRMRKTAQGLLAPEQQKVPVGLDAPGILHDTFRWFRRLTQALAGQSPETAVRYVYVSRGDSSRIETDVRNEAEGIVAMTRRSLPLPAEVRFEFVSERELIV